MSPDRGEERWASDPAASPLTTFASSVHAVRTLSLQATKVLDWTLHMALGLEGRFLPLHLPGCEFCFHHVPCLPGTTVGGCLGWEEAGGQGHSRQFVL